MQTITMQDIVSAHKGNHMEIIAAIAASNQSKGTSSRDAKPRYLQFPEVQEYQRYVYEKFADVINIPSCDYVSKVDKEDSRSWLIVGDNRPEIAARISLIIERYGIGVGMMVLHAQQMNSQHIPLEIVVDGEPQSMVQPTESLHGSRREQILYVPIREFRRDAERLAELNIVKPQTAWDDSQIVKHLDDPAPFCFYCSAREINPAEVVVNIDGGRLGLSRNYSLGYTFAPFGNPLSVMHSLAWDYSENPLNMNRTPMTVSDLVGMTRQINISIMNFFAGTGITDYPVIDGISNGWAGHTIYHQHFQFFQPEYESPIKQDEYLIIRTPILTRDDIRIHKLSWPTPIYKVTADDSINVGLVGNDMAGIWRLQGVAEHTQNLYVTGHNFGRAVYILLRDRNRVEFTPSDSDFVNEKRGRRPQKKNNIGVLEATGTMIVDDYDSFKEMENWEPNDISEQIRQMTNAICPDDSKVDQFEDSIKTLFP